MHFSQLFLFSRVARTQLLVYLALLAPGMACNAYSTSDTNGKTTPIGLSRAIEFDAAGEYVYLSWCVFAQINGEESVWTQIDRVNAKSWKVDQSWCFPGECVTALAVSRDGHLVAGGTGAGTVELWNGTTGKHRATIHLSDKESEDTFPSVGRVLMTPDGRWLVARYGDSLRAYDVHNVMSVRRTATWQQPTSRIASMGVDVLVADAKLGVFRATMADLKPTEIVIDPDLLENTYGLAASPRHSIVVTSGDAGIRSWRHGSQKPDVVAKENSTYLYLSVNLDETAVVGATNEVARVWQLPSLKEIHRFELQNGIYGAYLSPKGDLLLLATKGKNKEGSERILGFDLKTGKQTTELTFVERESKN